MCNTNDIDGTWKYILISPWILNWDIEIRGIKL